MIVLAALGLAIGAPTASAGELTRPTAGDGIATCLRSTGSAGTLALAGARVGRRFATELLAVSPGALQATAAVPLGHLDTCAAVSEAGGGAVAAGTVRSGLDARVVAAIRDPGGGFAAPVVLGNGAAVTIATAMSPRGDAAVAWIERRGPVTTFADRSPARLLVAMRPPGGRFGAPRQVFGWSTTELAQTLALAVGFDAAGTLTLAWTRPRTAHDRASDLSNVESATIGPGAAMAGPQLLGHDRQEVHRIALSVAPDGRALLAFVSSGDLELFERPSGSTAFAPGGRVTESGPGNAHFPSDVAVALVGGGTAAIVWREETFAGTQGRTRETVLARTRGAGGAFGAPRVVDTGGSAHGGGSGIWGFVPDDDSPPIDDPDRPDLQVAVSANGHAAMAWTRRGRSGPPAIRAATIAPDGAVAVRTLGSPCRRPAGVAALVAGGVPTVAFADNRQTQWGQFPLAGGALHVVAADELLAPRPTSPAPVAHVQLRGNRRLRYGQKLAVRIVCDRDCDLLVQASAGKVVTPEAGASARAGVAQRIVLDPQSETLISRKARGVPLRVTACAPDGTSSTFTRTVQPAVQVAARPGPVPRNVRARRVGRSIVVTWSIATPMHRISFTIVGAGNEVAAIDRRAIATVRGRLRKHFRVVLRPKDPQTITKVFIQGRTDEPPYRGATRTVRVSRR